MDQTDSPSTLLTFINYDGRMQDIRPLGPVVTLMLQDRRGQPWALKLSADCLRFVGRYRRLEGFDIDAALLFQGGERIG